jgi:hypothetical protein
MNVYPNLVHLGNTTNVNTSHPFLTLYRHIFVDKNSAGLVYVQFENMSDAMKAKQGLHGRWFAGHQVVVDYISEAVYYIRFPELKKKYSTQ